MDSSFSLDRAHDPLLFLSNDKSDLDNFLLTGGDMDHINDDLQVHITADNSLDFDALEGNGHLGDMHWLHNSSLSTMAHIDNEDTSDGTTMISVNPQSVLPMQIIEPRRPDNLMSSENANSAAMRLHANCSNLMGGDSPEQLQLQGRSDSPNILSQDHPSVRILSVAGGITSIGSPSKQSNFLITSTRDSPLKSQTYVLNTANGIITPGHHVTTGSQTSNGATGNIVLPSPRKLHAISTDKSGRILLKAGTHLLSPSQASPVLLGRLQTGVQQQAYQTAQVVSTNGSSTASSQSCDTATVSSTTNYGEERAYPKPVFSYSCLIALALKNSKNGNLPVSEIYTFMCDNFPYFKTAPDGWKNSVRHNLSLNKCFAKVDNPKLSQGAKKGCLWALNPAKITKMDEEILKWGKKDPAGLLNSMAYPENLDAIEKGQAGLHYTRKVSPEPVIPIPTEVTPMKTEPSFTRTEATPMKTEATFIKTEATPMKTEAAYMTAEAMPMHIDHTPTKVCYSPIPTHQFRPISTERITTNIPTEPVVQYMAMPVRPGHSSPQIHRQQAYSPSMVHRSYTTSPMGHMEVYSSPVKPASTADINHQRQTLSINDIHSTINADALTDIVLQNGMWESEDLENEINIDLICDSPSHLLSAIQSPLPSGVSPNPIHTSNNHSGYCSPSIQAPYSNVVQSPLPQSSPTPNSILDGMAY